MKIVSYNIVIKHVLTKHWSEIDWANNVDPLRPTENAAIRNVRRDSRYAKVVKWQMNLI